MSQQGGRPGGPTGPGPEDDWWGQLYDDASDDTGPAPAADSLDDRFASAAGTVNAGGPGAGADSPPAPDPREDPVPREDHPVPREDRSVPREDPVTGEAPGTPVLPAQRRTPPPAPEATPPAQPPGAPGMAPPGAPYAAPPGAPDTAPPGAPSALPPAFREPQASPPPPPVSATPSRPGQDAPADPPPAPEAPPRPPRPEAGPPTLPDPPPPSAPSGPTGAPAYGAWTPAAPEHLTPPGDEPEDRTAAVSPSKLGPLLPPPPSRAYVGTRPPTYDAEPTALPAADPDDLDALVPDTVLDGARYGACTLRAVSVRGDSARYRGEPRRDALLTARFGAGERALVLVAMATGVRTAPGAHLAAAEACRWIGAAVGRSHERLTDDIRAARRADLKAGLHRLTDRTLGKLRAAATEQGLDPDAYAATLRCLLLSADPGCRTRVFFGAGPGGLFRLRDREWQDIEPEVAEVKGEPVLGFGSPPHETPDGDRLTMDLGIPTPPSPYEPAPEPPREPFRFRTSVARPGDVLLMCGTGFAEPLRGEAELRAHLAGRWSDPEPPGLTAYLADVQVRVKGYADDRTAVAVWEA
ncbi:protein phosphatase 2C domain-containing protein [Streptomyces pseudogriseolus]|uniref:protein phosphatase 2C domain-containing protein n=2 Tax=Streptomyces pseudogriseolus TaxID=36817 RepID=UPI00348F65ED